MKKINWVKGLKYVAAFLIPMIFVLIINQSLDNDSWYVLAEGRHIVENGVYYTDVLSFHEGLNTVAQNYGFAVIFYLIYSLCGAAGLYIMMLVLNFIVCFLIYKICMLISNKNVNLSLLIMMVTNLMLAIMGFVTTRAQMVSFVLFLSLIYVLELYIKTNKIRYLGWIPLLSLVQVNLHASLWPMLICVMLAYIVDSIRKPKWHLQGYKTWPIVAMGVVAMLLGLINPYGAEMLTIMLACYGDAKFMELVTELHPFDLRNVYNILLYGVMVMALMIYIFNGKGKVRMRYLLMFFGFLALGLNSVKGMNLFILVMFLPMALIYEKVRIGGVINNVMARKSIIVWTGVLLMGIFIAVSPAVVLAVDNRPDKALAEAMDVVDENIGEGDKESLKIYVGYNDGGYVEFRGYRAYMDARGGDYLKAINGKEDILYEWMDFRDGKIKEQEFLGKYNFDYLLVRGDDDPLYGMEDDNYALVYEDSEEQTQLYERRAGV